MLKESVGGGHCLRRKELELAGVIYARLMRLRGRTISATHTRD